MSLRCPRVVAAAGIAVTALASIARGAPPPAANAVPQSPGIKQSGFGLAPCLPERQELRLSSDGTEQLVASCGRGQLTTLPFELG